jgi:hypothetical protein
MTDTAKDRSLVTYALREDVAVNDLTVRQGGTPSVTGS